MLSTAIRQSTPHLPQFYTSTDIPNLSNPIDVAPTASLDICDIQPTTPIIKRKPTHLRQRKLRKDYKISPDHYHSYGGNIHSKSDKALRIFLQNINGLTFTQNGEDYDYVHGTLDTMNVDVLGLSETNSPWNNRHLQNGYRSALNKYASINKTQFSCASEAIETIAPSRFQQAGGTATSICGAWTTRARKAIIKDPTGLGRWSGVILGGKQDKRLAIITGYRVCDQSRSAAGESTSFTREWEYYRDQGVESPNPRQEFLTDMKKQILALQHKHDVILMLDANDFLSNKEMSAFQNACNLHDLHKDAPAPTTYQRSTGGRIDYMLGTTAVAATVIQSGTLSYAEGLTSDHRGLFVDIDFVELLQLDTVNQIMPMSGRILKSGNPEMTEQYLGVVTDYFENHNMLARLDKLILQRHSKPRLRRLLNQLDNDIGRAMKAGESSLKQPPQKYQFSPKLRKFGLIQQYWRTRFRDHFNDEHSERTYQTIEDELQRYDNEYQLPHRDVEFTIEEIRAFFTAATKVLRLAQKEAGPLRYKFQSELVEKYRDEGDIERMRIVERTIQAEHSRAMFRKIGSDMKPQQRSSVSQVTVPHHPDKEWDEIFTPHEVIENVHEKLIVWEHVFDQESIEEVLLEYNRCSFRKASESQLGSGFIYDSLKFSSLSTAGSEILSGHIPESWNVKDPRLVEFLASFAIPDQVKSAPPIQTNITADDFIYGFKGWKEKTSTSPSGRHLGHYKAIIGDPALLSFHVKFLNLLVSNGMSLERWQNATNVLIEKDPGEPRLHRLRIIHLFEADYNFVLKLLWGSRLVKQGENLDALNNNQHGSRHDRQGMDPVHLQLLSMDLCRVLKMDMASFDNDASACYDRIIVALGMLAARRLGMPENAIRCHAQALEMMKYTVKTMYGISEGNYTGTPFEPLFGTGQGSGASPAVWLTLVVLLLNTLDKLIASRMTFSSPDHQQIHKRLADAFVDDTSMGFTSNGNTSYPDMIQELQHIAQTWEKLLHFSGGALNFKKCHWWLMYWEWNDGRPTLRKHNSTDPTIHLSRGRDPSLHPIKHSDTTQANRILGVYLAPSGDFTSQLKVLREKAQLYSKRLKKSRLTPGEAYTWYRTTYIPAMTYTLPAVSGDEDKLHPVQAAVLPALLNQLKVHSKYPTELRHGPMEHAGLELIDLKTESGISLLKALRDGVFSDKEHGRMMITAIKTSQLESGLSKDILMQPDTTVSYLTPTWVTTIRQYLANHGMSVELTDQLDMTPSCSNDQLIMDPTKIQQYTEEEQLDLNLVRIHTQAVYLSDLTTGDGMNIRKASYEGLPDNNRQSTYVWPRQPNITTQQRNRWQKYLSEQFLLSDKSTLKRPIGKWHHTTRNRWRFTNHHDRLFDHQLRQSAPLRTTNRRYKIYGNWTNEQYEDYNDDHQPCTIYKRTDSTTSTMSRPRNPLPPLSPLPHTYPNLRSYLKSLPHLERRLLQTYTQAIDDFTLWKILRSKRTITIASDGGLKTHQGTFGWKIVTDDDTTLFTGAGPVDGDYTSESSTRSELYGIAAPVLLLASLHRFWGTQHRVRYNWLCDSESALKQVKVLQYHKTRRRQQPNNVDILSFLSKQLPALGRRLNGQWVKAHQDDDLPYDELNREARLNVDADYLATWYRDHDSAPQTRQQTRHVPSTSVSISIGDTILCGNINSSIRRHINGYYSKEYMKKRQDWTDDIFNSVDWHNFGQHFKALPLPARIQRSKLVHRWQNVGTQRLRDAKVKDPHLALCPICQTHIETPDHLFQCDQRKGLRYRLFQSVTKITHSQPHHPALAILSNGIKQWLSFEPMTIQDQVDDLPNHLQPIVLQAINEQYDIRWGNALRGLLSDKWAQAAATHHITSKYDIDIGNGHVYRTIRALNTFTHEIWTARNTQLHKRNDEFAARIRTPIDAVIKKLYHQPELLHSSDRFRCDTALSTILNYNPTNKRSWVRRVKRAQERYVEYQTQRQQALSTYAGYTYAARTRPIVQNKPAATPIFQQTTLFGRKTTTRVIKKQRKSKHKSRTVQPKRRQSLIVPLPAP